jgi:hypothetical protein
MNIAAEMRDDRVRRLINQRTFRDCFVKCLCERGCAVCAYTGLVSKGQARRGFTLSQGPPPVTPGVRD